MKPQILKMRAITAASRPLLLFAHTLHFTHFHSLSLSSRIGPFSKAKRCWARIFKAIRLNSMRG